MLAYHNRNEYNQISIGERFAHSRGLSVNRFRIKVFFLVSLLVAPIVAHTGVIGFVGLILPHILRLAGFSSHRLLIPMGVVSGAMYLILADFMVHIIQPSEQIFTIGADIWTVIQSRRIDSRSHLAWFSPGTRAVMETDVQVTTPQLTRTIV